MNFLRSIFSFFCEDLVVAISKDSREGLLKIKFTKKKIRVIYSGINPALLKQSANFSRKDFLSQFGIAEDKFVAGTVAVLNERKGISYLIDAAKAVVQKHQNIFFVIVGSGQQEEILRAQIARLGLQKHIIFSKYQKNLADCLKSFNLMVLPSLTEGLPAVLLEAAAFGVPIVATKVGGVPEIIEDGVSGFLVPPKDSKFLAETINKAYENYNSSLDMAKKASFCFENNFTIEATARGYEKAYEELLKHKI